MTDMTHSPRHPHIAFGDVGHAWPALLAITQANRDAAAALLLAMQAVGGSSGRTLQPDEMQCWSQMLMMLQMWPPKRLTRSSCSRTVPQLCLQPLMRLQRSQRLQDRRVSRRLLMFPSLARPGLKICHAPSRMSLTQPNRLW